MKVIDKYFFPKLSEVQEICKKLNVDELYFLGSAINGKYEKGKSDLDILVKIENKYAKNIVKLNIELSNLFKCPVDIFNTRWKMHPEIQKYFKKNKVLVYKKQN